MLIHMQIDVNLSENRRFRPEIGLKTMKTTDVKRKCWLFAVAFAPFSPAALAAVAISTTEIRCSPKMWDEG